MKTVREIITSGVEAVTTASSAAEAAGKMLQSNVGALPVVDEEKETVSGFLTDRDIVLRVVAAGKDPNQVRSGEIMSDGVLTCTADDSIEEAGRIMEKNQVRRLLVMDPETGRPAGIISLGDVALAANPSFAGEVIQEVSKAS